MNSIEALTLNFYQWEGRCRGWNLYNQPVELEPPFEPFHVHAGKLQQQSLEEYEDDGKSTPLSGLFNLFKPKKKEAEPKEIEDLEPFIFVQAETNKSRVTEFSRKQYGTPKTEVDKILAELLREFVLPEKEEEKQPSLSISNETSPKEQPTITHEPPIESIEFIAANPIEKKAESQHRYLQALIKRMAESRGFKALLEESTPDGKGRVDVHLERNNQKIACEISVTTTQKWELQNIQKCLGAGYDIVVSISTDKKILENIKKQVMENIPNDYQRVMFFEPEAFFHYLDSEIAKEATTETRIKGYRVKVEYNPVSETEAKSKQLQILKAVTNSKKPKN